jgi:hypothetical protein
MEKTKPSFLEHIDTLNIMHTRLEVFLDAIGGFAEKANEEITDHADTSWGTKISYIVNMAQAEQAAAEQQMRELHDKLHVYFCENSKPCWLCEDATKRQAA